MAAILPEFEKGTVWLAGAGPGDPGLMTLLTAKGLKDADVIMHDALVSNDVLDWAGPNAIREFVGKRAGQRSMKQPEITAQMIKHAHAGKRVLRLKGGDPFVFGRGGEEVIELAKAKINFRVIPGVTSGIGGLTYAGIPATHRDVNNIVSFVTGRDATGDLPVNIDWDALASSSPVIVFFMALKTMPDVAANLIKGGKLPSTPVAIVSNATIPEQTVVETTLATYADDVSKACPKSPAIIIIGDSVKIRGLLKDYQQTISTPLKMMSTDA